MKRFTLHLALWTLALVAPYFMVGNSSYIQDFYINSEWLIILFILAMSATTANFTITPVAPSPVAPVDTVTVSKEDIAAMIAVALDERAKVKAKVKAKAILVAELKEELTAEIPEIKKEILAELAQAKADHRKQIKDRLRKEMIAELKSEIEEELTNEVLETLKKSGEPLSLKNLSLKMPDARPSSVGCVLESFERSGEVEKIETSKGFLWKIKAK